MRDRKNLMFYFDQLLDVYRTTIFLLTSRILLGVYIVKSCGDENSQDKTRTFFSSALGVELEIFHIIYPAFNKFLLY
jgi:hypothetical protein